MIGYELGVFDILRESDLQKLDRTIQLSEQDDAEAFGLGIYDDNLCEILEGNKPLKNQEDIMAIMQQIRGIDFVFSVNSLDQKLVEQKAAKAYKEYLKELNEKKIKDVEKTYDLGYAPGTYDLFHKGHLDNLMMAAQQSKQLVVGVKADELVVEHKGRTPMMTADERMDILRHFKFVTDVYTYYTRDLHVANEYIKSKYSKGIDAVFLGSDLKNDFKKTEGINIVYTPRDPKVMKTRSTTAYRKLCLDRNQVSSYTGIKLDEQLTKNSEIGKNRKEDVEHTK